MTKLESVAKKYAVLRVSLSERARRLWAGAEADAIGYGGVAGVAKATGMAISTVRKGRDEFRAGASPELVKDRRPGAGRPRLEEQDLQLTQALDALVHPTTRGDPESPLRWTCKSARVLARELTKAKHPVGADKVRELLHAAGYSLMANAKTKEGASHPDRNQQFEFINARAQDFISRGLPVVSVDSKKKEIVGEFGNRGREWQPRGTAVEVSAHDFAGVSQPQAVPYGIYDVDKNVGFVNVGKQHNTPTFAVRSIEKWWEKMGHQRYPDAKEIFVTADAGGSNSYRSHVWKTNLQEMADRQGVTIHVSHFPPGTSKWNKIEHRLFSFISMNWRGRPLVTYETVVALIAATTTSKGLTVRAELDPEDYPTGISVSRETLRSLNIEAQSFHGEWNYAVRPRTKQQLVAAAAPPLLPPRIPVTHKERNARWLAILLEQKMSGLSHSEFCRKRGLLLPSYYAAHYRLTGKIPSSTSTTK